jgi:hypothetical protein
MFRLDYIDASGRIIAPVLGSEIDTLSIGASAADVLTMHAATARKHARAAAERSGHDVLITRIVGGGRLKPSSVVKPDGSNGRPPGSRPASRREDCKRDSGQRCFCTACRAERKAAARAQA